MKLSRIILCLIFFTFWIGCCGKIKKIHKQSIGPVQDTSYFIVLEYKSEELEEPLAIITGSGVAVSNPYPDVSLIMTAAHVCIGDPNLFWITPEIYVNNVHGEKTKSFIMALDLQNDLCILTINKNIPITKIASEAPKLLDDVFYAGYPAGLYFEGILHKLQGNYSGIEPSGGDVWSFPATSGASGSPVYNEKSELIGIISSVHMEFPHVVMGANLESITNLLDSALSP